MLNEVVSSQTSLYQQWVQSLNDSYEAFRGLAYAQLRVNALAIEIGVASLGSVQSVLRVAIDNNVVGKLSGQWLRQLMSAVVKTAAYAPQSPLMHRGKHDGDLS